MVDVNLHRIAVALLSVSSLTLSACSSGGDDRDCETTGCPTGEACLDGTCVPLSPGDAGTEEDSGADGAIEADAGATDAGGADAGPMRPEPLPEGECQLEPAAQPFENPERELYWSGAGLPFASHTHGVLSPVVIDLVPEEEGEDSVPEIVFLSYPNYSAGGGPLGVLRVVSGRAPHTTLLTIPGDGMPALGPEDDDSGRSASLMADAHPAAGDLDGDGSPEIVALLHAGGLIAFHADGSEYWRSEDVLPRSEGGTTASVAIADIDQNGQPEIVVGRTAINGQNGELLWRGAEAVGSNGQGPLSCVADIVPDSPGMEVISGRSVYSATGESLWGTGNGFCGVADVSDADGAAGHDGVPEVIAVHSEVLYVLDGPTGAERWSRNLPTCNGARGRGGAPTVADYDGDGNAEIGVAGAYCYTVFDLDCIGAAGERPEECTGNGILWTLRTFDNSSNVTSSTVFDFNGDGAAEVVYADERFLRVIEGRTGAEIFSEYNPSRTRTEQPVVADVDNDGNAEIVITMNTEASSTTSQVPAEHRTPGLEVWSSADDAWVGARPIWNQHTYHIDNVGPGGTIPAVEPMTWTSHNTYRLNSAVGDLLAAPDLAGGLHRTADCEGGVLPLCIEIVNRGELRVGPGLQVTFYANDEVIGTASTTRTIDRGELEEVCIDWTDAPMEAVPVRAEIDDSDSERECFEDNNVVDLGMISCQEII